MEVFGICYFGLDGVVGAAGAELLPGLGFAAVGVTGLDHKFVDDAVEQCIVVIAFAHQL